MPTGFVDRFKGKYFSSSGSLAQMGKGLGTSANVTEGGAISGAQFAGTVGNTSDSSEDTLYTYSLPANCFDVPNRQLYVYAWGSFAGNADTKTAKLYFGTKTVTATGTASGTSWALEMVVMKSGANAQQISAQTILGVTHGGVVNTSDTETDTAAIVIKVTGQAGTANANDVVLNGVTAQFMN